MVETILNRIFKYLEHFSSFSCSLQGLKQRLLFRFFIWLWALAYFYKIKINIYFESYKIYCDRNTTLTYNHSFFEMYSPNFTPSIIGPPDVSGVFKFSVYFFLSKTNLIWISLKFHFSRLSFLTSKYNPNDFFNSVGLI